MNKKELLQMTAKEIEIFLNANILDISFESEDDAIVKGRMIDKVKVLFDNTVKISTPYYTNTEFKIIIDNIHISFKVGSKRTGRTVNVTRLRKKDIKTTGKFKFDNIALSFYNPYFEAKDLDSFVVQSNSRYTISNGASISLRHRKEKIVDMLTKDILLEEIQRQNEDWKDIRKTVVLYASQPKIKEESFKPGFTQEKWDNILQKTYEVNKELIDSEIEKMFSVLN
jgi:hypothetical protein